MNCKNKKFLVVLLVLFLVGSMASAIYAEEDAESAQEGQLKEITVGLMGSPSTMDPYDNRDSRTSNVLRNICGGIMDITNDGGPVYDLCDSITEIDEVTYELKVRQGILFHNGELMTADDFVFAITREAIIGGMDGETSPRRPNAGPVESVEKIDNYTVRVKMESPQNFLTQFRRWMNFTIVPKKYYEEVGKEGFSKHPIGCGPFKWVEGDINTHIVLERYEDYWGGPSEFEGEVDRIPALDRAIFVFIPEATTRIAALLSGEVDIIQGVSTDHFDLLAGKPDIKVVGTPSTLVRCLHFNVNKAPFNDKRVRQAIAYAIDYDLIVEKLYSGFSDPLYGRPYLTPYAGFPGFPADAVDHLLFEYNPEKARALLDEAGVSELAATIDTISDISDEAQVIAQMLGEIGIDISVRVWDSAVLNEEFRKGGRDMILETRGQGGRSPSGYDSAGHTDGAWNYSGYSNPVYDVLVDASKTMSDFSTKRQTLLMATYEIAVEDVPILWIHNPHVIEACRANVKNFTPHATGGRVNLHRVDIE